MYEKRRVVVIENGKRMKKFDDIAIESGLKIFVNGKEIIIFLCSPENLEYLAKGVVFTSGLIDEKNGFKSFSIKDNYCYIEAPKTIISCRGVISSGCGTATINTVIKKRRHGNFNISSEKILFLMEEFQKLAKVYKITGGVHCAGISDGEKMIFFHEDIGRHNAVDKVIGECLSKGVSTLRKLILTSGRISSEIVLKCIVAGIPIIVSRAAPTTHAIKIANLYGITIVGFLRGKRMNIYTHEGRIS